MDVSIEDLKAQAAAAKARRQAAQLSDEEKEAADLRTQIARDLAQARADEKTRRNAQARKLEAEARAKVGAKRLLQVIDLFDHFPEDAAPEASELPGGGLIVIGSPSKESYEATIADLNERRRPPAEILRDLFADNVVLPVLEGDSIDGIRFTVTCQSFPGVATMGGNAVLELGGLRLQADKRGRG